MRKFAILSEDGSSLTLPVTPKGYTVMDEMGMETVSLIDVGDYAIPTHRTLQEIKIDCLLPRRQYPFCCSWTEQNAAVAWLRAQVDGKKRVRFVVTDSTVNEACYIRSVEYTEQDGTGDLYATITLQEYRTLKASAVSTGTKMYAAAAKARTTAAAQTNATTYTVKSGDTLWGICVKFYGDGSLSGKLAAYNGIRNASLITVGQVLKIPDAATLGATRATQSVSSSGTGSKSGSSTAAKSKATNIPVARHTLKISFTGLTTGYATYSYIDSDKGTHVFGQVKSGMKLIAAVGTAITVTWRSQVGCYVRYLYLNGYSQAMTGTHVTVFMDMDYTMALHWQR